MYQTAVSCLFGPQPLTLLRFKVWMSTPQDTFHWFWPSLSKSVSSQKVTIMTWNSSKNQNRKKSRNQHHELHGDLLRTSLVFPLFLLVLTFHCPLMFIILKEHYETLLGPVNKQRHRVLDARNSSLKELTWLLDVL